MEKIRNFLKIFMFVELGSCAGNILYEIVRHKNHPEYYLLTSAPWYTGMLITIAVTAAIVAVTFIAWLILGYIIKKKNKD